MRRQTSLLLRVVVLAAFVVVPIEICSYFVARILSGLGILFAPAEDIDYSSYLERRDPLLGWPSPGVIGNGEYDASGSRVVPSFPDPAAPPCVELFGDSFTWGDEVSHEQAWGNIVAGKLNCRVANYGVPGYGTDQAFLRYRDRVESRAPVVLLGYWSENIVRNINRFRGFLGPSGNTGFKPRFKASEQDLDLTLIPIPSPADSGFSVLDLQDDWFAPGAGGGVKVARFPFTFAVVASWGNYRIKARLGGEPPYAQFYKPEDASGGFQTTLGIIRAFAGETARRNQRGVVLLIPSDFDIEALRSEGSTYYERIVPELATYGIEALDLAPLFLADLGARPACEVYIRCGGHLAPEGNEWLARYVANYLSSRSADPQ